MTVQAIETGLPSRPSKRIYPSICCKKPDCGLLFNPTNKRQQYCCPQHRIDHNNDLRTLREQPMKLLGKKLEHNQAALKRIHTSLIGNQQTTFSIQLLQYEHYNFGCYTERTVNRNTGNEIEWNHHYGIEGKDEIKKTFIMHYRKKLNY